MSWEIQGFIEDYGPEGRACWSTTRHNAEGVAEFLRHALQDDAPREVFLIRRGPQIEADDGLIGPYVLARCAEGAGEAANPNDLTDSVAVPSVPQEDTE